MALTTAPASPASKVRRRRLFATALLLVVAGLAMGGWLLIHSHQTAPKASPALLKASSPSATTSKAQPTPLEKKLTAPEAQLLRSIPYTFYLPSGKVIAGHRITGTDFSLYYDETHPARTQLTYYLTDNLDAEPVSSVAAITVYPRTSGFNPPVDCGLPGGSLTPLACTKYPRSAPNLPAYLASGAHFLDTGVADDLNATLYTATDTMVIRVELYGGKKGVSRDVMDFAYQMVQAMKTVPARDLPARTGTVFRPSTLDDGAWAAGNTDRPTAVGQCVMTRVLSIDTSGNYFIHYANGLTQAGYSSGAGASEQAMKDSQIADPIKLCLTELEPANCPPGDRRGKDYSAVNLRTGAQWTLPDSLHQCGGA